MVVATVVVASYYVGVENGKKQVAVISPTPTATIFSSPTPQPVVCAMDAKRCPDGSSVSRVPPSCAFAPCLQDSITPYQQAPLNPMGVLQKARNAQRKSSIHAIMNALEMYKMDYGTTQLTLTQYPQKIARTGVDLCTLLTPTYIASLPKDPQQPDNTTTPPNYGGSIDSCYEDYDSGFTIQKNGDITTIAAPLAEGGEIIFTSL